MKTNAHPSFEKMADVFQAGFKLSLSEDGLELPTSTSQPLVPVYEMLGINPGASCKLGKHSTKRAIAPPQTNDFSGYVSITTKTCRRHYSS